MSELPPEEHTPVIPEVYNETVLRQYRAALLATIEQQAPIPYTEEDMEREEYEADRMRGYNEALEETMEVIREVLGKG